MINKVKRTRYTVDVKKDKSGVKQNKKLLKYLLENHVDFAEEESLLQKNTRKMGVFVDNTLKCHARGNHVHIFQKDPILQVGASFKRKKRGMFIVSMRMFITRKM